MLTVALVLSGCGTPLVEEELDGLRALSGVVSSNRSGVARLRFDVLDDETSVLVTSEVEPPLEVFVRSLIDPQGEQVLSAEELLSEPFSKTNAVFVNAVNSLNWPVIEADRSLTPGRWELELGVVDEELSFTQSDVALDLLLKSDPDLESGRLDVALIYTDDLRDDDAVVAAVEGATDQWKSIYAAAGIELSFETFILDEVELLPPAFGEEPRIVDVAASTPARTVNVLISDLIDVPDKDILGIAGDIPGPLVPTRRSAIQISMAFAAGLDGSYDELDIRTLAETMAHETAHFLGLFHPVERNGWSRWDVLEDTPQCGGETPCRRQLGNNLMFPFPLCTTDTYCVEQSEITPDQAAVIQRYVGTH